MPRISLQAHDQPIEGSARTLKHLEEQAPVVLQVTTDTVVGIVISRLIEDALNCGLADIWRGDADVGEIL